MPVGVYEWQGGGHLQWKQETGGGATGLERGLPCRVLILGGSYVVLDTTRNNSSGAGTFYFQS